MEKLDLHGVQHPDVDRVVENFVLLNEPPSKIITGMSAKMQSIVFEVLRRNEIEYHIDPWNFGQVLIFNW